MTVRTIDLEVVTLLPHRLLMEQAADMNLFTITDYSLHYTDPSDHQKGVKMVVVMKRKITSEMMTTYFPSIMLTAITFATTFFKPFFFEAALTVNLTTMLVMTTIFISKMDGLPPTSDIKMIDIWLILCQLVPFAEVVLLTAIEYNSGGENGEQKVNHHGKMRNIKVGNGKENGAATASGHHEGDEAWSEECEDCSCLEKAMPRLKTIRKLAIIMFSLN